jgi:hypothetical protein
MVFSCDKPTESRRRNFWATQPAPCGIVRSVCGDHCGIPGLELHKQEPHITGAQGKSFATNDWVRGLLLNIFCTEARKIPTDCGTVPGQQGGHWSESYGDGTYIGTRLYGGQNIVIKSISDAIKLLTAAVKTDAYKLVTYGVATSVDVKSKYLGNLKVEMEILIVGPNLSEGRVNLRAQRIKNQWVWET